MLIYTTKYLVLCEMLWTRDKNQKLSYVDIINENIQSSHNLNQVQLELIKKQLTLSFLPQYERKWQSVRRIKNKFLSKYEKFLQTNFDVYEDNSPNDQAQIQEIQVDSNIETNKVGRPSLSYVEGSKSIKRRRILEMCHQFSEE